MFTDFANNKTSTLVASQLPGFVREDYPNFVAFIQAYYQYLEQEGKLTNTAKNLQNYIDVDYVVENNLTPFIENFRKQYLNNIPTNVLADKAKLIKHIKQFYSSKGTEKSFKFLFRILFNQNVEIFDTGTQVLRASAGTWYQPSVIRIRTANNLSDWVTTQIMGTKSFASAVVESGTTNFQNNFQYNELTLSNITKPFLSNELITATTSNGVSLFGTILSVVPEIDVINQGSLYNVGDPVIITGGGGANASASIAEVSSGSLISIGIVDGGSGFQVDPNFGVTITGSSTPTSAKIFVVDTSGSLQPSTYFIDDTIINASFSVGNSNTTNVQISNSSVFIPYANSGPLTLIHVIDGGQNYTAAPNISIDQTTFIGANSQTRIVDLGIIGTIKIVTPGIGYQVNDDIKIINLTARGAGFGGRVATVNANGAILTCIPDLPSITGTANVSGISNTVFGKGTIFRQELLANNDPTFPASGTYIIINGDTRKVLNIASDTLLTVDANFSHDANTQVVRLSGFNPGGFGYTQHDLINGATLNVISRTGLGSGAFVQPDSILGAGYVLAPLGGVYGKIVRIQMNDFGDSYTSAPNVDLTQSGDGTATAEAKFIGGVFTYPGVWLTTDSMLDSNRFLQDAFQYNSYSYIIKSPMAVKAYHDVVYQLLNPVGSNIIGVTLTQPIFTKLNIILHEFVNTTTILLDINFILDFNILL